MGRFFRHDYPYTDFHELNLDWFLTKFKELASEWASFQDEFNDVKDQIDDLREYVEDYFEGLNVQEYIDAALAEMLENGTLEALIQQAAIKTFYESGDFAPFAQILTETAFNGHGYPQGMCIAEVSDIPYLVSAAYYDDGSTTYMTVANLNTNTIVWQGFMNQLGHCNSLAYTENGEILAVTGQDAYYHKVSIAANGALTYIGSYDITDLNPEINSNPYGIAYEDDHLAILCEGPKYTYMNYQDNTPGPVILSNKVITHVISSATSGQAANCTLYDGRLFILYWAEVKGLRSIGESYTGVFDYAGDYIATVMLPTNFEPEALAFYNNECYMSVGYESGTHNTYIFKGSLWNNGKIYYNRGETIENDMNNVRGAVVHVDKTYTGFLAYGNVDYPLHNIYPAYYYFDEKWSRVTLALYGTFGDVLLTNNDQRIQVILDTERYENATLGDAKIDNLITYECDHVYVDSIEIDGYIYDNSSSTLTINSSQINGSELYDSSYIIRCVNGTNIALNSTSINPNEVSCTINISRNSIITFSSSTIGENTTVYAYGLIKSDKASLTNATLSLGQQTVFQVCGRTSSQTVSTGGTGTAFTIDFNFSFNDLKTFIPTIRGSGNLTCVASSVTTSGATVTVYNNGGEDHEVAIWWMAVGN